MSDKIITPILIQTRMGSTRLPRKCFEQIGGLTLTEHCWKNYKGIAPTWFLVPAKDAELIKFMDEKKIKHFDYIGDETNVAARYYAFLQAHKTDWFCRITADCPFIPETVMVYMMAAMRFNSVVFDLVTNVGAKGYVDGFDVEWVKTSAFFKQYDTGSREHVTAKMYNTCKVKKIDMCFEPYKSIDTQEDLDEARKWYERNGSCARVFN